LRESDLQPLTNLESIRFFIPELVLIVFAVGAIILDLKIKSSEKEKVGYFALAGVVVTLIAVISLGSTERSLFLGMIRLDSFAVFFKVLILIATGATILFSIGSD